MTTAASYSTLVQELYVAYFGRPADYFGLQNFEAALAAANAPTTIGGLEAAYGTNAAVKSLVDSFGTSAESTALYGSGSTESFVNAIFENLLNRPAAVAGLTFWVNAIDSGQVTRGDAALAIAAGAAANTTPQGLTDQTTIANKLAVASTFTTDLGASSEQIVAYSGASAATAARLLIAGVNSTTDTAAYNVQTTINNIVAGNNTNTYNLTTGVDTVVGGAGNDVFNAVLDNAAGLAAGGLAATLQVFDTITGGTLNNTLNITDFGMASGTVSSSMTLPSTTAITGITTLNVNTLEGVSEDLSGWNKLVAANILSSSGTDNITVGDTVALNVVDSNGTVTTTGGSTVAVKTDTSHMVTVNGGAATSSVSVTGGSESVIQDANFESSKANTITSVILDANGSDGAFQINSNALTALTLNNEGYAVAIVNAAAGARTLNLSLSNDSAVVVIDPTATAVNVAVLSEATAAKTESYMAFEVATAVSFNLSADLDLADGPGLYAAAAKTVTISGTGAFSALLENVNSTAAVNAAASSGVITVELASAGGQSFVGGSGQGIVYIGATQTAAVTGGSAGNNEIVLNDAGAATVADIAGVTHFTTFGVAGDTYGSFDMSKVSGYNAFDVQSSGSGGGDVTFTNAATGSSLSLENGNSHIVTLQTIDTTGATDSVTVHLGTATDTGSAYSQITLEDANFVGTANVTINANTASSGDQTSIGTLNDTGLLTLSVTGTGTVAIGTLNLHSTTLTITDAAVADNAHALQLGTLTDNALTSLTLGGATGISIDSLSSTSANLTITDSDAGSVSITNLADTSLTTATFTNSVNTTAATFAVGASAIIEASLATLNLNGNVAISITGDTVAGGITVAGATDNADVSFSAAGATASGKVDNIALGNGNDTVTLGNGTVAVPGATEVDTVTWKAITGTAAATQEADVTWQAIPSGSGGTETVDGQTVTSDGTSNFSAAQVASVALGNNTISGLTLTSSSPDWTAALGSGSADTIFVSKTANTEGPLPVASATGDGTAPGVTETQAGTPGASASESIGGATVSTTLNDSYTAAQVATVAGGGTVPGLTLSASPTLWTIGSGSGDSTTFTSTTANHAESSPTGAGSTGAASDPTSTQITAGVTPVTAGLHGMSGSTDTITLGTGNDAVTDYTIGTLNVTLTESSTSTDSVTANNASALQVSAGNGINTISDTAAGASISITLGTGANSVTLGAGSHGTISFGVHTGTDTVSIGASGTSVSAIEKISGLNNAASDTITFSADANTITSFTQVTAGSVVGSGGNTTFLADWVAAAAGASGSLIAGTAHSVVWFQFQGNTYLLETAGADTGHLTASDTLVELTGTNYTFAKAAGTGGVLHLLG